MAYHLSQDVRVFTKAQAIMYKILIAVEPIFAVISML